MVRGRVLFTAMVLFIAVSAAGAETASAGVFDKIKDIYEAPDRIDELRESYDASIKAVEGQLGESRRQAEQLLQRQEELEQSNEEYRTRYEESLARNEALPQENERLVKQMDELEQNRQSMFSKAAIAAGAIVALIAVYTLSVRIWRYLTWRRQGRDGRRHEGDGRGVTLP